MKRIAFLVSGEGWLFEKVTEACTRGLLEAEVVLLITNKKKASCLSRAQKLNIDAYYVKTRNRSRQEYSVEFLDLLKRYRIDLVVTMFNRLLSGKFVEVYKNQCVNLHLSLLPSFAGKDPRSRVLVSGARFTGATIHFIDDGIDTGPIIAQASFPISPELKKDELFVKYGEFLPKFLLNTLDYIVSGKFKVDQGKVFLRNARYDSPLFSPSIQEKFKGVS